jgi:basic membrane protein A and related proteins
MVKLLRLFVLIHTVVVATACGTKSSGDDGVFRVALLTPGPISDQAWNSSAYKGLERIRDSLGAEISHIQTKTPAEFEENFRQYGAKGFDLVIGHGFEFQDAAQRVGPEYPKTVYLTTGGSGTGPNIAALSFAFDEPSFFAGIAAASVSQNGVMAVLGGTELPPVKSSFAAFEAGARSVRPDIQVLTAFIGNWDDAAAGKEQALALMSRRADVIFQNADAAGLGAFQAVRERGKVWIIGANADQNQVAPEVTLGSVVIDLPHAFLLVAREVKDGTFTPRVVRLDTKSEVVRWVPNPSVQVLSKMVTDHIDTLRAQLVAGTFTIPASGTP